MLTQTISLFRYLLIGIISWRLLLLIVVIGFGGLLLTGFVTELAIINSQSIASALLADVLRYSFVFLMILLVATNVAEDFDYKQFDRLLTMPISRWQYVFAQVLVVVVIALALALSTFLVLVVTTLIDLAFYWCAALFLELLLVGMLGLLAILSLEKIPQAVFLTVAIYWLSKLSGLIAQMLTYSVEYSDGSASSRFADMVFNAILHVVPNLNSFAQNDIFFNGIGMGEALMQQAQGALVYIVFLLFGCLVDFYRKEFNR